ncbi:MAG TPA: hypothetical protein VHE30_28630 [Polyangiaceae bacterium]|nr:hypothetical protein [Polyangiaceae bacterium]
MTGVVRLGKSIHASREDLFRYCATTQGLERWYADRVTGRVARGSEIRLEWSELGAGVDLRVTEVIQNESVVFENGESRLTLRFGDGTISLLHEGPDVANDVPGFESSWQVALAVLAHALTVHGGRPRRTRWVTRPARTSASRAHVCFTEPEALSRWFGHNAWIGAEGEEYELELADGEAMQGTVLARVPGRDVAYVWEDRGDSVLVMRTLPLTTPGERLVALCWSQWTKETPDEDHVLLGLERALERLALVLAQSGDA